MVMPAGQGLIVNDGWVNDRAVGTLHEKVSDPPLLTLVCETVNDGDWFQIDVGPIIGVGVETGAGVGTPHP